MQQELPPPPQLFVRNTIGSTPESSSILTLNTHSTAQWDHDLMIDARLFGALSLGDILEVRKVPTARQVSSTAPLAPTTPASASAAGGATSSRWGRTGSAHAYYDSDSEHEDSDDVYSAPSPAETPPPMNVHSAAASHHLLISPASQRAILQSMPPEDDENLLLMEVTTLGAPLGRVQISINRNVAEEFSLLRFSAVRVAKLTPANAAKYEAVYVELSFRGRYLSNGELWLVRSALRGRPVYVGKIVKVLGVKMKVEHIHHLSPDGGVDEKRKAKYGIVSRRTRFVFRSGAAQIFWLIQCSVEMWGFADDGDLMLERLFSRFIPNILDRWNACNAKHSLTVVFFTRTVFNGDPSPGAGPHPQLTRFPNPEDSRRYVDFYHVALSNVTRSDWKSLLGPLQDDFHSFPRRANWASRISPSPAASHVCGLPSIAQEGNILEAINLSLNVMQNQHIDRDLVRTGQLMVLLTAGSGVFEVDARLARLTKDRMTNHAVGCDIISLTQPPAHVVPLFIHNPCPSYSGPDASRQMYEFDQPHPFVSSKTSSSSTTDHSAAGGGLHSQGGSSLNSPSFPCDAGGSLGSHYRGFDTSPNLNNERVVAQAAAKAHHHHHRRKGASKIPLFNIPYWINLSFPFHRSSKEFQPIFENRMFPIPDPQRSNFPSALLAPLERVSRKIPMDLDLSTPVAMWATSRKIPSRDEMRSWFPLVSDLLCGGGSGSLVSPRSGVATTAAAAENIPLAIETKRISSPVKKSATGTNLPQQQRTLPLSLLRSSSQQPVPNPGAAAPPPSASSGGLSSSSSLLNVSTAGSMMAQPSSSSTLVGGSTNYLQQQHQQQQHQQQLQQRDQQRLEPSPSLVALQLFTGGTGAGASSAQQPKVSWIQDSSAFALPPPSASSLQFKSRTFSMLGADHQHGYVSSVSAPPPNSQSLSAATTASSSLALSLPTASNRSTLVNQFDHLVAAADESAIRAKQKRHDAQVFAPPHQQQQQTSQAAASSRHNGGRRMNVLPVLSPNVTMTLSKQSVNDLATLAMTPSMSQKPPPNRHHRPRRLPVIAVVARQRRGASENEGLHAGTNLGGGVAGGLLQLKPLRFERSLSLNSSRSYTHDESATSDADTHASTSLQPQHQTLPPQGTSLKEPGSPASSQGSESPSSSSSSSSYSSFTAPPAVFHPPQVQMASSSSSSLMMMMVGSSASSVLSGGGSSAYMSSQFVNPFQMESLMKWYCERPSHSRSRWLHLFPNSRLDGLRYFDDSDDDVDDDDRDDDNDDGGGESDYFSNPFTARERAGTLVMMSTGTGPRAERARSSTLGMLVVGDDNVSATTGGLRDSPQELIHRAGSDDTNSATAAVVGDDLPPLSSSSSNGTGGERSAGDVNWKSLQTPAILPLTTGFAPTSDVLAQSYSFGTYSLVGQNMDKVLLDVICQRLSEDFQLYDPEDFLHKGEDIGTAARAAAAPLSSSSSGDKENYILTVGHHVHVLSYSPALMKLDVTVFGRESATTGKDNDDDEVHDDGEPTDLDDDAAPPAVPDKPSSIAYRFLLWDADFSEPTQVSRAFQDQSASECNWNYVDTLLTGDESIEDLPGSEFFFRFKRLHFCLFDQGAVAKLVEFLQEKLPGTSVAVRFQGVAEAAVLDSSVERGPTLELDFAAGSVDDTMQRLREREWIYLNTDDSYHPRRAFHVEIRWIVASGESVARFVDELSAKVGLVQCSWYCADLNQFDMHPFVAPRRVVITPSSSTTVGRICQLLVDETGLFLLDSKATSSPQRKKTRRGGGGGQQQHQEATDQGECIAALLVRAAEASVFCRVSYDGSGGGQQAVAPSTSGACTSSFEESSSSYESATSPAPTTVAQAEEQRRSTVITLEFLRNRYVPCSDFASFIEQVTECVKLKIF